MGLSPAFLRGLDELAAKRERRARAAAAQATGARLEAIERSLADRGLTLRRWRGPWDAAVDYLAGDGVQADGSSWIALKNNRNSRPSKANEDWDLLAAKGERGPPGPMPKHQVVGRRIRFELSPGKWGPWIDLASVSIFSAGGSSSGVTLPAALAPISLPASEDLPAGALVNVWEDAGATFARLASASAADLEADGFVLEAVAEGEQATVYPGMVNSALSGLTRGARYYLAEAPGQVTTARPSSGADKVLQFVGRALSPTSLLFRPSEGTILE